MLPRRDIEDERFDLLSFWAVQDILCKPHQWWSRDRLPRFVTSRKPEKKPRAPRPVPNPIARANRGGVPNSNDGKAEQNDIKKKINSIALASDQSSPNLSSWDKVALRDRLPSSVMSRKPEKRPRAPRPAPNPIAKANRSGVPSSNDGKAKRNDIETKTNSIALASDQSSPNLPSRDRAAPVGCLLIKSPR